MSSFSLARIGSFTLAVLLVFTMCGCASTGKKVPLMRARTISTL